MNNHIENINEAEIKSVAKALTIINYMSEKSENVSLQQITKDLGLPKSTLAGLLKTLEQYNFVDKLENNKYELGIYLFELGTQVRKKIKLDVIAKPHLEKLANEIKETVNLGILDKCEVLLLDKYIPSTGFQIGAQIGTRLEAHSIALGKVLLSHLTDEEINNLYKDKTLTKNTPNTITDLEELKEELKIIKRQGYAVDNEELLQDMRCIAAPIYNNVGDIIAAASITTLVSRLTNEKLENKKGHLMYAVHKISKELGYDGQNQYEEVR